jgi:hypothetical protein
MIDRCRDLPTLFKVVGGAIAAQPQYPMGYQYPMESS